MSHPTEVPDKAERMRARFRERLSQRAPFREDRALAGELTEHARPLFAALAELHADADPAALHDAFALLAALSARAAELQATASVAVTLPWAVVDAARAEGMLTSRASEEQLLVVGAEAFIAAREEHATRALRRHAADSQIALTLAPGCSAILLAGAHAEVDLEPVLERHARALLRDEVRSCLLDVTRLSLGDEETRRMLGRFCAQAISLGVPIALVTSDPTLAPALRDWGVESPLLSFFADYARAQQAALSMAGREIHARRAWTRLFLSGRSRLVR